VSGAASTILSIIAARRQKGPSHSVSGVPDMLARLLGGHTRPEYISPAAVLHYLQSIPPDDPSRRKRLEQLKQSWIQSGRLDSSNASKQQQTTAVATSSEKPDVKVSIDDLTNRIAMVGDVLGRVSLIRRDLSVLMSSSTRISKSEKEKQQTCLSARGQKPRRLSKVSNPVHAERLWVQRPWSAAACSAVPRRLKRKRGH
jgi:hypothetical protein